MERTILHCDMNNFFASVECAKNPSLADKPLAVCGSIENRHGIVLAKNMLAKAYGITTGETVYKAKAKCRNLVTVEADYDSYLRYSARARRIYEEYTDRVEALGIDECWLDVTGSRRLFGDGFTIACTLKERIKAELDVTISVGVSFNKTFAKLGSDMKKPDAVTCIPSDRFQSIVWKLPASDLFGVGPAVSAKLKSCGIYTIGQLAGAYEPMIRQKLGKNGTRLIEAAGGRDTDPVMPCDAHEEAKSFSHGTTPFRDMTTPEEVKTVMLALCEELGHRLLAGGKHACGIAVYARDSKLRSYQCQCQLRFPTDSYSVIAKEAFSLLMKKYPSLLPLRSVSVAAIDLCSGNVPYQTDMFSDTRLLERAERIDRTMDAINLRFGKGKIRYGVLFENELSDTSNGIGFGRTHG